MALLRTAPGTPAVVAEVPVSPFAALGAPDAAWSHPEGVVSAASYGEVERREGTSLRAVLAELDSPASLPPMPGPWFGAAAFSGTPGRDWAGFSPLRFTLPELLAWSEGARHFVAAFGKGAERRLDEARARIDAQVNAVHFPDAQVNAVHLGARVLPSAGERDRWNALVARALAAIAAGQLDKVVVARAIEVEAQAPLDPEALLGALSSRYPTCRSYLLRAPGAAFVGATPELLCRIEGDRVYAEALAGSARPGEEAALLGSRKDLREHQWVVDHVASALSGVADSLQRKPEPGLRALANVVHLHTPIAAHLAPGRGVADVAAALHPTPAVGGVPVAAALRFLADHEDLDRGLYAGVVGWVGPGRAELAVALRSALVRGRRARLFVGSGIVEGSSADGEWEETELKARALLDALEVRR